MKKIVQIVAIQFSQRLKIYKNTPNIQVCIFWSSSDMQIFAGVLLLSKEQWWQFRCYHVTVLQLWLKWKLTWQCFSSCGSVDCIPAPGPSRKNIQQKAFFMHILLLDWIITIAMMRNASGLQIHCQSWRVFSFLMKIASRNSNEKKRMLSFSPSFLTENNPILKQLKNRLILSGGHQRTDRIWWCQRKSQFFFPTPLMPAMETSFRLSEYLPWHIFSSLSQSGKYREAQRLQY